MHEVFISYSRKDIAFAKALVEAVHAQGINPWIDWEDIPPSADWLAEIYAAIEASDTFVFIISNLSAQSEICGKEIEHAIRNGKRIIPVVVEDVDPKSLPPVISEINWIFYRENDDFQKAFDTLIHAIQLDLGWVKEHTRLQVRALEWEKKGRDSSYLLRGKDLQQGEQWFAENRPDRKPQSTQLQNQYLIASRQEASKRARYTLVGVSLALIITVLLAILALVQRNTAIYSENLRATAQNNAVNAGSTAVAESIVRATAEANANTQSKRANAEAQVALARRLAAQADLLISQEPKKLPVAVLLSLESLKKANTAEGSSVLRKGLSLLPALVTKFQVSPSSSDNYNQAVINNPVTVLKFSPDGRWLGVGTADEIISVWDVSTWKEVIHFEPAEKEGIVAQVCSLAFSPDGNLMITGTMGRVAQVWDIASGKEISRLEHNDSICIVGFTPDGRRVISGSGGEVVVWDPHTGTEFYRLLAGTDVMAISSNGKLAASAGKTDITVWEVETGKILTTKTQFIPFDKYNDMRSISALAFSPDGSKIASSEGNNQEVWLIPPPPSIGGRILIWDPLTGKDIMTVQHGNQVPALAFNSDGTKLVSGSFDNTSRVWDVATGRPLSDFSFNSSVGAVAFGKNDEWIVSSSYDGTARIWDARTGEEINRLITEDDTNIEAIAITPDGKFVAGGNHEGVWVWQIRGQQIVQMEHGQALTISSVDYSPDGKMLATASWDGKARTWDTRTGALIAAVKHDKQAFLSVFSPDGKYVASADLGGQVKIWDPFTGIEPFQIPKFKEVSQVLFSSDGKFLAISEGLYPRDGGQAYWVRVDDGAGVVSIWDVAKAKEVAHLQHDALVNSIAFTPDGKQILSASKDGIARLWDIGSETILSRVEFNGFLNIVAFSPDGRMAAGVESCIQTGMGDGGCQPKLQVWNSQTGEILWNTTLNGRWVSNLAFSPNSKLLVSETNFMQTCEQQDCKNSMTVWNASNGAVISKKEYDPQFGLMALAFNKDGSLLATGGGPSHTGWVDIWDPESGNQISRISYQQVLSAAFSPTGNTISIVGNQDGAAYAKIFSLDTQNLIDDACARLKRNFTMQEVKDYLGDVQYEEVCPVPAQNGPNGPSDEPRISRDGQWIAFTSKANNLSCTNTNASSNHSDIFTYNPGNGSIQKISNPIFGQSSDGDSQNSYVSGDGNFIVYSSSADNLVAKDLNKTSDIFLYDRATGQTDLVSVNSKNEQTNSYSLNPSVSDDGRFVVFESAATNLIPGDNNEKSDIFIHDRKMNETRMISMSAGGTHANDASYTPLISPDGENILFFSNATNLVDNKNTQPGWYFYNQKSNTLKSLPFISEYAVDFSFLRKAKNFMIGIQPIDGGGSFGEYELDEVALFNSETNTAKIISLDPRGNNANRDSESPDISDDNRWVVFASEANNLVEGDHNLAWDIFMLDQHTGTIQRIIMGKNGTEPNGHSLETDLSGDGRTITFSSTASNLVDGDSNAMRDVFIYDTQTRLIKRIEPMVCR